MIYITIFILAILAYSLILWQMSIRWESKLITFDDFLTLHSNNPWVRYPAYRYSFLGNKINNNIITYNRIRIYNEFHLNYLDYFKFLYWLYKNRLPKYYS